MTTYFGYYGHSEPTSELPTRPRHELHPLDKLAFMRRWYSYHRGESPYQPPLLRLPNTTLGLKVGKECYVPTEKRIRPTYATIPHLDMKPPHFVKEAWVDGEYLSKEEMWDRWKHVILDHLSSGISWRTPMELEDFGDDAPQWLDRARRYAADFWITAFTRRPIQYTSLQKNSVQYGYNIYAMLNWILDDAKTTEVPRIHLPSFLSELPPEVLEDWKERFEMEWPTILDEGYRWWKETPVDG